MTDQFGELYENLINGIEDIEKNNPDSRKQIESCFHLCEKIIRQVDTTLAATRFDSDEEEIIFFKNIRPGFTSLVEFYSTLYRAELFIPENKTDQIEFWNDELKRARLFLMRNAGLLSYLRSEDTSNDKVYFLRTSENSFTAQGELVAKLLSRENYIVYIIEKILPRLTATGDTRL